MAIQFSKLLSLMAVSSILSFSYSNYSFAENLEQEEELEQQDEKKEVKTTKMGGRNITAYSRKGNTSGVSVGGYFDSEYYFPDGKSSYFDQHRLITQLSSLYNDRLFFNC
jgi:hypothetical protein